MVDQTTGRLALTLVIGLGGALVFYIGALRSKRDQFYTDTWYLIPLGVYVWGDALVLGPFWVLSGLLFFFLGPIQIVRFYLTYVIVRAGFETVYWLVHQSSARTYTPPLLRAVKWLGPAESAIVYQLLNTVWVIFAVFALQLTYRR